MIAPAPSIEPERFDVKTNVTPSGIEVKYTWDREKEKGWYELRSPERPDGSHNYDWFSVPRVSDALDTLKKDGLHWWGMTVGVEGMLKLYELGLLVGTRQEDSLAPIIATNTNFGYTKASVEQVVDLLKKQHLTVNDVRDKAGDRGQAVHDVLEMWAKGLPLPDLGIYPPSQQGYVAGLYSFLKHVPSAEPVASEVMVGSLEHGFAGRYDVRFRTTQEHNVIVHRTPIRGPQWARLVPGLYLGDLKTTKRIYDSHSRQLEAYEGASVECGYEATDGRGVLLVQPDGTYVFKRSYAEFEDFLVALEVYRSNERMKERA